MSEILNTIGASAATFANAKINWGANGGVPWFLGSLVFTAAGMAAVAAWQAADTRRQKRVELYREAEAQGHLRSARRDWCGYVEYHNY